MNSYQASARMQYAGFTLFVAGSMTGDESDMYSQFVRDTQPEVHHRLYRAVPPASARKIDWREHRYRVAWR
jgi:hypothetical protein